MALQVTLSISETQFSMLDDPRIRLELVNEGPEPLLLIDAANPLIPPVLRLTHLDSGETRAFYSTPQPGRKPDFPEAIGAGATLTWSGNVHAKLHFDAPGQYELVAEIPYNAGEGIARSKPLMLTVEGAAPIRMQLARDESPFQTMAYAFWVDKNGEGFTLNRTTIYTADLPKIFENVQIDRIDQPIDPVVSVTANLNDSDDRWLTWLSGETLQARYVDAEGTPGQIMSIDLPGLRVNLIPDPFLLDSGELEIPLWVSSPQAGRAKLQLAVAGPRGLQAGTDIFLPSSAEPAWVHSAFTSKSRRRVYMVFQNKNRWQLNASEWGDNREIAPLQKSLEDEGRVLGGGLSILPDDTVLGLTAFLSPDEPTKLGMIQWAQEANGEVSQSAARTVQVPGDIKVDRVLVRFDKWRQPHTLLKALDGRVYYCTHDGPLGEVGGLLERARGPLGLLLTSMQTPIIVFTRKPDGLAFSDPRGRQPTPVRL